MKRILHYIYSLLAILLVMVSFSSCHSSKKTSQNSGKGNTGIFLPSEVEKKGEWYKKASAIRKQIVDEAYTWLGTPYAYACSEKGVATDCSGMVLQVYEKIVGVKLPRNSAKQAEFCKIIPRKEVVIGDLVFFATGKNEEKISHVGIMIDDKNFIHASASKGVVISDMTQPYYVRTFKGFGRVE